MSAVASDIASDIASAIDDAIGVVVIGRNEGERLRRCLASLLGGADGGAGRGSRPAVVYVDSGSTDGSVALAESMGASVVALDMARPFTAARARNAGFERLMEIRPSARYVQFVDGDCEIVAGWLESAVRYMDGRGEVAALSGRIRERNPEDSIYNRLTDREWDTATGDVHSCAGVCVMRVEAFKAVGGFDPSVAAGEEPEICLRLRNAGHVVVRVPETMALHDVAMHSFRQWWRRQVRGGYGALDVAERFGQHAFKRQVRSARIWAIGWPAAVIAASAAAGVVPWRWGWLLPAGVAALFPAQALKIAISTMLKKRVPAGLSLAHGSLIMLAKFAAVVGQWRYVRDRRAGIEARLIEHKAPAPAPATESASAPSSAPPRQTVEVP